VFIIITINIIIIIISIIVDEDLVWLASPIAKPLRASSHLAHKHPMTKEDEKEDRYLDWPLKLAQGCSAQRHAHTAIAQDP